MVIDAPSLLLVIFVVPSMESVPWFTTMLPLLTLALLTLKRPAPVLVRVKPARFSVGEPPRMSRRPGPPI